MGIAEGTRIEHPALVQGERVRMKIMMIDPDEDLPVETIHSIFQMAMEFYK